MRIAVVVGNPRAGGRTTVTGMAVANRIASELGDADVELIELADHAERLFTWSDPDLEAITERVAGSDLLVVACPTYKASFTGMLKAFLDRYGSNGLAGVVAVPVMLGAGPHHALAPETQLRPVLVELGASVPARAVYHLDSEMGRLDQVIDEWWEHAGPLLVRALGSG